MLKKKGACLFLLTACIGGFLWLFLSQTLIPDGFSVCFFKNLWGIPCPACGTTHGVEALFNGDISTAFGLNPNSFIVAACLVYVPLCSLYDVLRKDDLLYRSFVFFCRIIDKPAVLMAFLIMEALIWGFKLWSFSGA